MRIFYKSTKLEKVCTDYREAVKTYGVDIAEKLMRGISYMRNAESHDDILALRSLGAHPLKGNRDGEYAIKLAEPFRLIYRILQIVDGKIEYELIKIESVEDYHGKKR